MKALEERIRTEGVVLPGDILKVGSFLNQQIDTALMMDMGAEIARLFRDGGVTRVLTIEASGIPLALAAAYKLGVPMVFAKKSATKNMSGDVYCASVASYTHGNTSEIVVSSAYIQPTDRVLIVDDFLAKGAALHGLISLCRQAGAAVAGACVAVEKWYQGGGDEIRAEGIRVESLAKIRSLGDDGSIVFC